MACNHGITIMRLQLIARILQVPAAAAVSECPAEARKFHLRQHVADIGRRKSGRHCGSIQERCFRVGRHLHL